MGILVVWLLFALVAGAAAAQRGRSFAGWTLVAIFLSPLLALILLVILPNVREQEARDLRRHRELIAATEAAGRQRMVPAAPPPPVVSPHPDPLTSLAALAEARDRGLITAEEFDAKKAELLGRM